MDSNRVYLAVPASAPMPLEWYVKRVDDVQMLLADRMSSNQGPSLKAHKQVVESAITGLDDHWSLGGLIDE